MATTPEKLEELEKQLYSREGVKHPVDFAPLPERHIDAPEEWKKDELLMPSPKRPVQPLLVKLFIGAVVFFLGAIAFAAYYFLADQNLVSPERVDIYISGPTAIDGGEELSYQVSVNNRNPASLESAHLTIEYPDGTRTPLGALRTKEDLESVKSGAVVQRAERATLFGEEGDIKNIKLTLDFRVKGSNATFYKEALYEVILGHSPLRISVDSLREVTANQETTFTVIVESNSSAVIKDALLRVEYPFGFQFRSGTPTPLETPSVWFLGDIRPEEKKVVRIRGVLVGQDEEERIIKFSVGTQSEKDERKIDAVFGVVAQSILIKKPFLGLSLSVDGDTATEYSAPLGKPIRLDLSWSNNLLDALSDVKLEIKLRGTAIDKSSVVAEEGFYQSLSNTVTWDQTGVSALAQIAPGNTGQVSVTFATLPASSALKNPEVTVEVNASGKRLSGNVSESVESQVVRKIKFSSATALLSQATYSRGPFVNEGPLPPKAEQETSYTVIWTLSSASNIVRDGKVTATLPSHVRFAGNTWPSNEKVSFNPVGGQVVWDVGDLAAGGANAKREIAFKVVLLPSLTQVGSEPTLLGEALFTGQDQFANTTVSASAPAITTRIANDPNYKEGQAAVAK